MPTYPFKNSNGDINCEEYLESLVPVTRGRESKFYDSDSLNESSNSSTKKEDKIMNKAASYTQPVFLKRNLRKMKMHMK